MASGPPSRRSRANRVDGVSALTTPIRSIYNIHFVRMPITLAKKQGKEPAMVDKDGLIYVLHEEEHLTRANDDLKLPAVIRANVYDCVDVLLTSEWDDDDYTNFQSSKINIHPHFFQFDTGNSDGVISGFEYEMSVRPFTMWGKKTKHGLPAPMVGKAERGREGRNLSHQD